MGTGSKKGEKILIVAMHRARMVATATAGFSKDTVARSREQGVYKELRVRIKGTSSQPSNAMMGTTGMEMGAVLTAKIKPGFLCRRTICRRICGNRKILVFPRE